MLGRTYLKHGRELNAFRLVAYGCERAGNQQYKLCRKARQYALFDQNTFNLIKTVSMNEFNGAGFNYLGDASVRAVHDA